jgi:hypothetical protein
LDTRRAGVRFQLTHFSRAVAARQRYDGDYLNVIVIRFWSLAVLTIRGKVLGRRQPLFADWSVPWPPDMPEGGISLREVIARIVREEVSAFKHRQAERQVFRALTARQIQAGADKGKIAMGGSDVHPQEVDEETAVGTAWQAFEDGLYLVVIDGQEYRCLDEQIFLQPDSEITFIRLALLAGG